MKPAQVEESLGNVPRMELNRGKTLPRHFLIIGAQKAGTTSLYHYLGTHPDIFASPVKETKYFLNPKPTTEDTNKYRALFSQRMTESQVFEASPHYTQYPRYSGVPHRIHAGLPDVRLIYILRHPIERIYSHYLFRLSSTDAREHRNFDEAVKANPIYVNTSSYHLQLNQYLQVFPKSRILILLFEELLQDPHATLRRVFGFLDVDPSFVPPNIECVYKETAQRTMVSPVLLRLKQSAAYKRLPWRTRNWMRRRFRTPPPSKTDILTPDSYNRLHDLLRDDVERLRDVIQRDLPWDFPRSRYH
jgi:hypothetical protein